MRPKIRPRVGQECGGVLACGCAVANVTWQTANYSTGTSPLRSIATSPENEGIVYLGISAGLRRSIDGGSTWSVLTDRFYVPSILIDLGNPKVMYASLGGSLGRSTDGGDTWEYSFVGIGNQSFGATALAFDPSEPSALSVGTQGAGVRHYSLQPDLALSLNEPAAAPIRGSAQSYIFHIDNTGPHTATNLRLQVTMPENISALSVTTSANSCTVSSNLVSCAFDRLRVDQTIDIGVLVTPSTAGTFNVVASLSAAESDAVPNNNQISRQLTVSDSSPPQGNSAGGGGGGGGGTSMSLLVILLLSLALRWRLLSASRPIQLDV